MEYTTGGGALGAIMLIGGLAGGVFSGMLASRQLNQIKADLKANDPDAYLPESAEMTQKLEQDAKRFSMILRPVWLSMQHSLYRASALEAASSVSL